MMNPVVWKNHNPDQWAQQLTIISSACIEILEQHFMVANNTLSVHSRPRS